MTLLDDHLNLCEALKCEDASKWEATMQKNYDLLIANGTWELTKLLRIKDANECFAPIKMHWVKLSGKRYG